MSEKSTAPYRFGDLLALARLSWVAQMAGRLEQLGYRDYRRSDAAVTRALARGPLSVGELAQRLGVSRQAARKLIGGLERRGHAGVERDARDARKLNVVLSEHGTAYTRAVVEVLEALNRELCERVDAAELAAADTVLRAAIADAAARARAARLVSPPPCQPDAR